ncbi:unnamed protein product, partial [Brenthis ino]
MYEDSSDKMNGYQKICVIVVCIATLQEVASSSTKESRTGGLNIPEKIIGGVIEIVQSHKNKPVQGVQPMPSYPPNAQYNYQQYPQYQQWNSQSNYQNQGYQTPTQYPVQYPSPAQGQYSYQNSYNQAGNFPQGGNFNNQAYPAGSGQTFTQGQAPQGPYQGVYQNSNQFSQPGQFQNQQSGFFTNQNQASNQYQGSSSGFQGQSGQGQGTLGNGQISQGFLISGGQQGSSGGGGQGPTCVCQAWTKPQPGYEVLADTPVTEKNEKKEEITN